MVEAAIAIFILGVTFLVFLTVLGDTARVEFSKRDDIIAANLAQEGIEIVRQRRDNNWKDGCSAFGDVATANCVSTYGPNGQVFPEATLTDYCGDYSKLFIWSCSDHTLKMNSHGFYEYDSGTPTKFSRFITVLTPSGNKDERLVTVKVTWGENDLVITDTLYAWGNPE